MTGPFFSVGPCRKQSLNVLTDISGWISALQTALLSCNWTTVSTFTGSGGTLGIIMRTFPTPNLQTAQLTVYWDGSQAPFGAGAIISFLMADSTSGHQQAIGFVTLLASKLFTLYVGPHQFFLVSTNAGPFQLNYVMGGVPATLGSANAYWGCGDSGNGGQPSFTNTLAMNNSQGAWAYLLNGVNAARPSANLPPQLLVNRSHKFLSDPQAFADGTVPFIEAMLVLIASTVVLLWDAIVISASFTTNLDFILSGRTFEVLTLNFSLGALAIVADDSAKPLAAGYAY